MLGEFSPFRNNKKTCPNTIVYVPLTKFKTYILMRKT